MHDFGSVILAVIPVFAIVLAGVAMRRAGWLTAGADQSLLTLTINLLVPALIVDSILQNQALKVIGTVMLAPFIGFTTVALGVGLALWVGPFSGLKDLKAIRTFALCIGVYNYAYVCLPLAKSLFPGASDTIGVLFAHNLGTEVAMWIFGLLLLQATPGGIQWKKVLNAPVVTIAVVVPLNYFGADQWIPSPVLSTAKMLGQCAIPLGLILIGATVADYLKEFRTTTGWRVIIVSCILRLGILPALFLLIARYLPCSVELKRVIVMQSGMASAIFPIIMAKHYGGSPSTAVRIVIGTAVASLLTMPLWVRLGMKFAGI